MASLIDFRGEHGDGTPYAVYEAECGTDGKPVR